jgi:DNA-binding transcriptional LysR family regulator
MSLYLYEVFKTVAEYKSFSRTAEAMHITPSAVSHAIANLEDQFGFALFERSRKGVQLTVNGEKMLPLVNRVRECNENVLQEAGRINDSDVGEVRIGVLHSVALTWMPEIIKRFKDKYPKIEVRIYEAGYNEISDLLYKHAIDIGIVADSFVKAGQMFELLVKDHMVCVVPADFTTKSEKMITVEEIKRGKLLMQYDAGEIELKKFLEDNEISVDEYIKVDDDNVMVALVEQGLGISVVPGLCVKNSRRKVKILGLKPDVYRNLGLVTASTRSPAPATVKMIAEIKNYVKTV